MQQFWVSKWPVIYSLSGSLFMKWLRKAITAGHLERSSDWLISVQMIVSCPGYGSMALHTLLRCRQTPMTLEHQEPSRREWHTHINMQIDITVIHKKKNNVLTGSNGGQGHKLLKSAIELTWENGVLMATWTMKVSMRRILHAGKKNASSVLKNLCAGMI